MTNERSFADQIEIRDIEIQGETNWHWPIGDKGAFGDATDGPMRDWIESHSIKYFKYLESRELVVTAGACCGMHTRFYAKEFDTVYAFEPDHRSFHCMVNNTPFRNVHKFNSALGSYNGVAKLDISHNTNVGVHKVVPETDTNSTCIHIPILTIDSLNLPACSLIQLDVEHYEESVLLGATETIEKYKPVIICEHFNNLQFMERLGYKKIDQSFSDSIFIRNNSPWS